MSTSIVYLIIYCTVTFTQICVWVILYRSTIILRLRKKKTEVDEMRVDEMKMKLNKIRCRRNGSKLSKATAYQTELGKYGT